MRTKIVFVISLLLLLSSCSSSRKVIQKKKPKVVNVEPSPKKLPSVKQNQHVNKLKKSNKTLNKYTLAYIRKYNFSPIILNNSPAPLFPTPRKSFPSVYFCYYHFELVA